MNYYGSTTAPRRKKPVFRVLLLADSRARGLTHRIHTELSQQGIHNVSFSILFYPGATIVQTVQRAMCKLKERPPYDLIYLSTGINNLTTRLRRHCVVPNYSTTSILVKDLLGDYFWAKYALTPYTLKTVVCELIGMSMSLYNTEGEPFVEEQFIINEGMLLLNPLIQGLNTLDGTFTPHIVQHTHKSRHGRMSHRYKGTLSDGVHFNEATKTKMARNLVYTIQDNIHATCN